MAPGPSRSNRSIEAIVSFQTNPRTLMVPASVAKLVSLATAADAVGWNYRFETTLQATGADRRWRTQGRPRHRRLGRSIDRRAWGDDLGVWVTALKVLGIRRIDGRIIGDDDAFEDPRPGLAWAWDDLGYSFGSLYGALNLDENRLVGDHNRGSERR
jgi:D-alanyl-D-alanine carboxypeptidase/D-alanyl-D-alanine-endopeptidase (penicillin-binding protein 4)